MKKAVIQTDKLCKTFSTGGRQQHVLKNLDLEIYEGDFTVIMGASGSGKSTLLYALSGMDRPTLGQIHYGDLEIGHMGMDAMAVFRRLNCGFVFQQIHLLDNMNVLDNVLVTGLLVSKDRKKTAARARELLKRIGIQEEDWKKFPAQLSGGEAQRVGIVRALINKPRVIFADEPTGALNSSFGAQVLDTLSEIHKDGQTLVVVTHDTRTAERANRILYLKDGMICGELNFETERGTSGEYQPGDERRRLRLHDFLTEMGW